MRLLKKLFRSSKGYSLVELVITIAIMSIVTAGIGAAVVSATKNYNKGTTEVNIQTNGQNITNILTNLVIDSSKACSAQDGSLGSASNLYIKDTTGKCYAIVFVDKVNPNGTGSLYYGEGTDYASAESNKLVLAENVVGFNADTTTFDKDYTVHITMDLHFPSGDRNYRSSFSVASRNAAADSNYVDNLDSVVIISETMVVVEPNEDGDIKDALNVKCKALTSGSVTNAKINFLVLESQDASKANAAYNVNVSSGLTVTYDVAGEKFKLKANENLDSSTGVLYIKAYTDAIDPATGAPYDTKWITVYIRRVSRGNITKDKSLSSASTNQAGSYHTITGTVVCNTPERKYGLSSDNDYAETDSTPYDVIWTVSCTNKNGNNTAFYIGSIVDTATNVDVTSQFLSAQGYKGKSGDTFKITLKNQVPKGEVITFEMNPMHPQGIVTNNGTTYVTNKASLSKYNVAGTAKTYPCTPGIYKITSGFFEEISDYQRGTVLNKTGFGDASYGGIYNEIFKDLHTVYKSMDQNAIDSNGHKVSDVTKWFEDFKDGKYPCEVKYVYRIMDYTKDLNGNQDSKGWSQYRDMTSSSTNFDFNKAAHPGDESGVMQNAMTNRLNADTYQSVEFVVMLVDKSSGTIYWPSYDALMGYGFGNYSDHYGLGYSFYEFADSVTEDYSSYATTFDIVPARIEYYENANVFGIGSKNQMVGSTSDPLVLGDGINGAYISYEQAKWVGLDYKEYQNRIAGILMSKKAATSWSKVAYFGEPNGIPQWYTSSEGGFKVGSVNNAFRFDTSDPNVNTSDYDTVYRVAPIIYEFKLGYIKEEEQVWSKNVYYDKDHTYTYLLSGNNLTDDPMAGAITFKRYGNVKTIELVPGEGATCSQNSVSFVAGKGISLPTPSKTGYVFLGWYDAAYGGNQVANGSTNVTASKLWARWEELGNSPQVVKLLGSSTITCTYNNQSVTGTRYQYLIANNSTSGNMTVYFEKTAGSVYMGAGTANNWITTGNDWYYSGWFETGTYKIIEIDVIYGSITGFDR